MELSNAAMLLIKRMEEYPEDFSYGKRFGYMTDSLEALVGLPVNNPLGGVGRLAYLSDTDRAALAEAWRKLRYGGLEKEIMTTIFKSDAEFEEEKKQFAYPLGISQQATISPLHNTIGNGYQNTAQNSIGSSHTGTGLLGGFTGLFK